MLRHFTMAAAMAAAAAAPGMLVELAPEVADRFPHHVGPLRNGKSRSKYTGAMLRAIRARRTDYAGNPKREVLRNLRRDAARGFA